MFEIINDKEISLLKSLQDYLSYPFLDWFFPFYTDLHKYQWFILTCTLPLIFIWIYLEIKRNHFIIFGFFLTILITDSFCGQLIKKNFERPRPFEISTTILKLSPASGYSFTSNHAANSIAIATYLSYFYPKQTWIFFSLAILTAFSRLYNGVHFPSDIIIGGLLGFTLSKLVIKFLMKFVVKL